MLDSALRPLKDRMLSPLVRGIGGAVHPNLLTVMGATAGVGCALLLYRREYALGLTLWLLNRLLDGLDGAVARGRSRQSDLGGYLDILLDFGVYALVPIALAYGRGEPETPIALVAMLAAFYVNTASWMYLAALLEKRGDGAAARREGTSVTMPAGLVEGTETIVLYSLFMLFPGALPTWFWATTVLVGITVLQRVAWATRHL